LTHGRPGTVAENERNRDISPKRRLNRNICFNSKISLVQPALRDVANIVLMHISVNVSQSLFSDISRFLNFLIVVFCVFIIVSLRAVRLHREECRKNIVNSRQEGEAEIENALRFPAERLNTDVQDELQTEQEAKCRSGAMQVSDSASPAICLSYKIFYKMPLQICPKFKFQKNYPLFSSVFKI